MIRPHVFFEKQYTLHMGHQRQQGRCSQYFSWWLFVKPLTYVCIAVFSPFSPLKVFVRLRVCHSSSLVWWFSSELCFVFWVTWTVLLLLPFLFFYLSPTLHFPIPHFVLHSLSFLFFPLFYFRYLGCPYLVPFCTHLLLHQWMGIRCGFISMASSS